MNPRASQLSTEFSKVSGLGSWGADRQEGLLGSVSSKASQPQPMQKHFCSLISGLETERGECESEGGRGRGSERCRV